MEEMVNPKRTKWRQTVEIRHEQRRNTANFLQQVTRHGFLFGKMTSTILTTELTTKTKTSPLKRSAATLM